jgi:hypothetical protein
MSSRIASRSPSSDADRPTALRLQNDEAIKRQKGAGSGPMMSC